ncbi:MAG: YdeI/OmpD-associated family protein [Chitinophagaceae bacterium]|nr:YdeI/OmpD-associated family protein [Chitinophagaceae bacterium]
MPLPGLSIEPVYKGFPTLYCADAAAWRAWLQQYHQQAQQVWLVIFRKGGPIPSVTYPEALDEALCFGWIDSKINKRDTQSHYQFFSVRNAKSNWSQVNKEKVEKLIAAGKMAPAGLAMVALAKETGTWTALDEVEAGLIPPDLQAALAAQPPAAANFESFPRSARRGILEWIMNAKTPATRQKRILETARLAARNERANQYKPK